jgi:putative methyltransferase (TIGR04325 family)
MSLIRIAAELLQPSSFARLFPTFAAAAREGAYDSHLLTRFRLERARLNVPSISAAHLPPGYALLFAAAHLPVVGPVRVTDLGGACGEWGFALGRDARREIAYTVVENPALAAACAREPAFTWARFTAELPAECDVLVSSGTLQYLEEPYEVLAGAFATARVAVVLARNGFADRELFRVHRSRLGDNGFGAQVPAGFDLEAEVRYAHRTISLDRVLAVAAAGGWRCLLSLESPSGVLPYRGQVFGRDLLFVRADARGG